MLLPFPAPLTAGRLLRRYKRFLADVRLDSGEQVTAHCVNTGSMRGCAEPGSRVLLSPASGPRRKLRYTWEIVQVGRTYVGINCLAANRLAARAVEAGAVPELRGYARLRREAALGPGHRVDLLLEDPRRGRCAVEVKNVTLAAGRVARFPDAVTARGRRHVEALGAAAARGERSVLLFIVQRADCRQVAPAAEIDPDFAGALRRAAGAGLEVLAYRAPVSRRGVRLAERLPVDL